ncbi:hypothetical protein UAW_02963 [Enterococcus haemoperoxidus ATCC BAA-382]|uniref:Uncharacterized protein n=1 Tax=Enterococcus haemoperoxidus ATCC BAA-382 TaxID=1158608 RepID=R2Q907_9ENTE|nr:hypothetical protein UAW_02963 [Enterococcus haemoperoxidus ATCC BAA-382]EOT61665.1 hypothetical protein I583_00647 [Enterococcus haemoperoxidus ATCC BAA-382]
MSCLLFFCTINKSERKVNNFILKEVGLCYYYIGLVKKY